MADTENIDIVELGIGDALAGLVLSTEAGWNQNEADWRFFLSKGVVFGMRDGEPIGGDRCAAALLGRQCLDQHGAGHRGLPPPRHCNQAHRCLPRCGDTARPDDLAGRHAGGRRCLRPARLHLDAAIAPAAAGKAVGSQGGTAAIGLQPRDVDRARCRHHGIRSQFIVVGIPRSRGFPYRVQRWSGGPDPRMDAPHGISVRCSPITPIRHWHWWTPSSDPRTDPGCSMPFTPMTSFWTASSAQAGTSSGRFSACAWAAPPPRLRNCLSPSPDRNLDRNRFHAP